jgi:hypothetical protein
MLGDGTVLREGPWEWWEARAEAAQPFGGRGRNAEVLRM